MIYSATGDIHPPMQLSTSHFLNMVGDWTIHFGFLVLILIFYYLEAFELGSQTALG